MCFSRRQTTLQRRWPLPIPITRVNRSGIPKCDQTSRVAPVNDKLGIVHVIVVTPKLIDPIRDTRRRLDVRASFMCGPISVVAHTYYPEKTNKFPYLNPAICTNFIEMEVPSISSRRLASEASRR